jgi:hypothetical protein
MLEAAASPSQTATARTATASTAAGVVGATASGLTRRSTQSDRLGNQSASWLSGPSTTSTAAARVPVIPASITSPTDRRSSARSGGAAWTGAATASSPPAATAAAPALARSRRDLSACASARGITFRSTSAAPPPPAVSTRRVAIPSTRCSGLRMRSTCWIRSKGITRSLRASTPSSIRSESASNR